MQTDPNAQPELEHSRPQQQIQKNRKPYIFLVTGIILSIVATGVVFLLTNNQRKDSENKTAQLQAKATSLKKSIQAAQDKNKGAVAASEDTFSKDKIELVDKAISLNMPQGWARLPIDYCGGGSRDSEVLCRDIASIAPTSFIDDKGTSRWVTTIAVYDYDTKDGSAKDWYEQKYDVSLLSGENIPAARNIKIESINSHSTLSYDSVEDGAYVRRYHVIVHDKYAVVINAQLQDGQKYGTYMGAKPYDYQKEYGSILQTLLNSVTFRG